MLVSNNVLKMVLRINIGLKNLIRLSWFFDRLPKSLIKTMSLNSQRGVAGNSASLSAILSAGTLRYPKSCTGRWLLLPTGVEANH